MTSWSCTPCSSRAPLAIAIPVSWNKLRISDPSVPFVKLESNKLISVAYWADNIDTIWQISVKSPYRSRVHYWAVFVSVLSVGMAQLSCCASLSYFNRSKCGHEMLIEAGDDDAVLIGLGSVALTCLTCIHRLQHNKYSYHCRPTADWPRTMILLQIHLCNELSFSLRWSKWALSQCAVVSCRGEEWKVLWNADYKIFD